jgi:hypothetical protein
MQRTASPDTSDGRIEQELAALGKTAPRITSDDIKANIESEHYFTAAAAGMPPIEGVDYVPPRAVGPLDLLTICVLVLRNGFTVTGTSACASPENFDAAMGRKLAKAKAFDQVWHLMGYELRSKLAAQPPLTDLADLTWEPVDPARVRWMGIAIEGLQPHQQRVVDELCARAGELERLEAFIGGQVFKTIPEDEQARLRDQATVMTSLTNILRQRIAAFLPTTPKE